MTLFAELKRRNVIRMAGLYLVGAWLVVQVAETLLPAFDVPAWVLRAIIIVLALGFIPALVFSWVFELTPGGLKRDEEVPHGQSIAPQTARRMDRMIIAVLALALVYFAVDKFVLSPRAAEKGSESFSGASKVAINETSVPKNDSDPFSKAIVADAKTIAVLPFADFSPGGNQQWFADGLSEEILNALARTPDLQVSARTSSFQYKGSKLGIPKIAAALGVAHVLEGSVRSTPERIRVTAQLIRAADGFHLWSQTYDRDVADMIQIQEDLARQIATAMQTSMDPKALADMAQVGTRSVEAYQAFLRAQSIAGVEMTLESYELFERARTLDPGFAAAHFSSAFFWVTQLDFTRTESNLTELSPAEMRANFAERIDMAIGTAPTGVERTGYQALKAQQALRLREAKALYREYLAERPREWRLWYELALLSFATADQVELARVLAALLDGAKISAEAARLYVNAAWLPGGNLDAAADRVESLAQRWQDDQGLQYQAHRMLLWAGRTSPATVAAERYRQLGAADERWNVVLEGRQACAEGRRADLDRLLADPDARDLSRRWHLIMLSGDLRAATDLLMPLEREGRTAALAVFLVYPDFDPTPFPSLMRMLEREKIARPAPTPMPFACPATGAAR